MKNTSERRIVQEFLAQELSKEDKYTFEAMYIVTAFYRWMRWKILQRCYQHAWNAAMKHKVQEWITDQTLNRSDAIKENFDRFLTEELGEEKQIND